MNIHKLHIFAKNRDAIAAQKGYAFQQLKTLEDWIENRINEGDDVIYCDYEDDIFARNVPQEKVKFSQIKLYKTDFSFLSESIKTAIAHFFMLYIKGEYAFDQTEFSFETNASVVANEAKDNDAALLREWFENQADLSDELISRIRPRIRQILEEYIKEVGDAMVEKRLKKNESLNDIEAARQVYDRLRDDDIDAFIRCVKWRFDGIESNRAIEEIVSHIDVLIQNIPLPLDAEKVSIYRALLVGEVYARSIRDDPEDRVLTAGLLDEILLNAGDKEDQWYADTAADFNGRQIKHFFTGEFHAVITGARYCRWNNLDEHHKAIWLALLKQYIDLDDIPVELKRKAIYEYLFLKIGHDFQVDKEESPIGQDIGLVQFYIEHWQHRGSINDIEDDITLLQLLKAQVFRYELSLPDEDLLTWQTSIQSYLDSETQREGDADRLCLLLELQGHMAQQAAELNAPDRYKKALAFYLKIPPLLEKVHLYSMERLYQQTEAMIDMLIEQNIDDGLIELADDFLSEIEPYVQKSATRHASAKKLVQRGVLYMENVNESNYFKALDLFHRAKELYRQDYTKEGYILALLNISQVYAALGMTYAARYYALAGFWNTWHFSDNGLYKRLPQAFELLIHNDHKNGAWLTAINDFDHYLALKREFEEKGLDMNDNEMYQKTVFQVATIIQAARLLYPGIQGFIDAVKARWSFVWKEQIKPFVEQLDENIGDAERLKQILPGKINDNPLNDAGTQRAIRFNALGNDWKLSFENTGEMTAIAEEFAGFLQIALCEIARIAPHVLSPGSQVNLTLRQGSFEKDDLGYGNWVIHIPAFDSKDSKEVNKHYSNMGSLAIALFRSVSVLTREAFQRFYIEQLLQKERFGDKVVPGAAYQRAYRKTIGAQRLETLYSDKFQQVEVNDIGVPVPKCLTGNRNV